MSTESRTLVPEPKHRPLEDMLRMPSNTLYTIRSRDHATKTVVGTSSLAPLYLVLQQGEAEPWQMEATSAHPIAFPHPDLGSSRVACDSWSRTQGWYWSTLLEFDSFEIRQCGKRGQGASLYWPDQIQSCYQEIEDLWVRPTLSISQPQLLIQTHFSLSESFFGDCKVSLSPRQYSEDVLVEPPAAPAKLFSSSIQGTLAVMKAGLICYWLHMAMLFLSMVVVALFSSNRWFCL